MSYLLNPLTPLYFTGMKLHRFFSDKPFSRTHHLPKPVISVGNLTWGGTGKTPLVLWLADYLRSRGKAPAILMRGFGADEVKLYQNQNYLLGVGKDRTRSASKILQSSQPSCFILDDGFQHWPLSRDLDIVCVNALDPFGNGYLIPAGSLREPITALKRAGLVVLTNTNQVTESELKTLSARIRKINKEVSIIRTCHDPLGLWNKEEEQVSKETFEDRPYFLVSGLGSPEGFYRSVRDYFGKGPNRRYQFKDHHAYTESDLNAIFADAKKQNAVCIISEKDWVRSAHLFKSYDSVLVFKVRLAFTSGEELLTEKIQTLFNAHIKRACVLSDGKTGHVKQSLAFCEHLKKVLGEVTPSKELKVDGVNVNYRSQWHKSLFWALAPLMSLSVFEETDLKCVKPFVSDKTYRELKGIKSMDWIVSAGSSLLPLQLILARKFSARNAILMKPTGLYGATQWDLVIQPIHDGLSRSANTISTLTALATEAGALNDKELQQAKKRFELNGTAGISFFVGGNASGYQFAFDKFETSLHKLEAFAQARKIPVFITTSRRTSPEVIRLVQSLCKSSSFCKWLVIPTERDEPRVVETMLALSSAAIVTEESVSMISEALTSGRHVISLAVSKKALQGKRRRFQQALEARGWLHTSAASELDKQLAKLRDLPEQGLRRDDEAKIEKTLRSLV
jgi:tetraacyldisaccharide 4'-kinase